MQILLVTLVLCQRICTLVSHTDVLKVEDRNFWGFWPSYRVVLIPFQEPHMNFLLMNKDNVVTQWAWKCLAKKANKNVKGKFLANWFFIFVNYLHWIFLKALFKLNIFSSLVRFLTNAAGLPFCLKGNLNLHLSCGLKMFFGICFYIYPLREKGTCWWYQVAT